MPIKMAEFKKKKRNKENQMQTKLQRRKNQFCLFMEMRIGQSFRRHLSRLDKAKHGFDNDISIILLGIYPK